MLQHTSKHREWKCRIWRLPRVENPKVRKGCESAGTLWGHAWDWQKKGTGADMRGGCQETHGDDPRNDRGPLLLGVLPKKG